MAGQVCRFLALSAMVSLAQCSRIRATITPSTPSAFTDRNLTMNCTLEDKDATTVTANSLNFSWTNPDMDQKYIIRVINNRTINLVIWRVYFNMSSSRISCHLGGYVLDEVRIVVDEPRFPKAPNCTVYNWKSMTCNWEMDDNDNRTISLAFSRARCGTPKYFCPNQSQDRGRGICVWRAGDASRNMFQLTNHCFSFLITNAFNATALSRGVIVDVEKMVKPDPVSSIRSTSVTGNHIELDWSPPEPNKLIEYRITYESRFSSSQSQSTRGTSMRLSNLIPNTKYVISVECIPVYQNVLTGYWSDRQTVEHSTKPDVPGESPSVTSGGFLVFDSGELNRKVKLFFQPIDDYHSHGKIESYRVRRISSRSESVAEFPTSGWRTNVVLPLEAELGYAVSIDARTTVGFNESLDPETILIGRKSELPQFPENFVVQSDDRGTYWLNWSLVDQASSYTVYWCNSSVRVFDCVNPLDWKVLPSNQTSEILQLVGHPEFSVRFAISVEKVTPSGETMSSGMLVANCTFSKHTELSPPEIIDLLQTNQNQVTVYFSRPDKTASFEKCAGTAYASHYRISYCPKAHCTNAEMSLIVESFHNSVLIDGLEAGEEYEFRIQSLSETGSSSAAAEIGSLTITAEEEKVITVATIVTLVLVCAAFCAVPVIVTLLRWWKKKWHIEVKPPPKYINESQPVAGEHSSYSKFVRVDLRGGTGQVQSKVFEYGPNGGGLFNFASEADGLLGKHDSEGKSPASSSPLSPVSPLQSSSASSQFSDAHRDSGISNSISGYRVVCEQPSENSDASPTGSGTGVPHDHSRVILSESF